MPGSPLVEKTILATFRDFGDKFRKVNRKSDRFQELSEKRVALFQLAVKHIRRDTSSGVWNWFPGRDLRPLRVLETDLLTSWGTLQVPEEEKLKVLGEKLSRVDIDLRTPLILRDVLGFEEDEVMRILDLRWGVYRHRMHRARLDFKDSLKGPLGSNLLPAHLIPTASNAQRSRS